MSDHTSDLLRRAKTLCDQVRQLHEISFEMGQYSHVCDPESLPELHRTAQVIIDAAGLLSLDLEEALGLGAAPPLPALPHEPGKIIRLKDHLKKLPRKTAP